MNAIPTMTNADQGANHVISHTQPPTPGPTRCQPTGRGRISRGVAAIRASQSRAGGSGAPVLGLGGIDLMAVAMVALALTIALLFTAGAQAASYSAGPPLSTGGKLASGVAVNQSTHNVYVASCGSEQSGSKICPNGTGSLKEFNSAGTELSCALEGSPTHPSSVAVDPENGHIYVFQLESFSGSLLIFGESCGAQLGASAIEVTVAKTPPQPAIDSAGNIYLPVPTANKLQECTPTGVCTDLITSGLTKPVSAAFDASGDLYVSAGATSCANISAGKVLEYKPNGSGGFTEVGAFAGLNGTAGHGEVSTVAVDKKTGQVFVGRGCGSTFRVERYRAGGGKLDEFGSGLFEVGGTQIYNQLAIDESSGKVYATDEGHEEVQTFGYSGPALLSLGTSVVGEGSVVCEVEGHEEPCAAEYETGTEVTLKALKGAHSGFVKWSNATGAAEASCKNKTTSTCTFTISSASTVQAEFVGLPTRTLQVTVTGSGKVSEAVGSPAPVSGSISNCTSAGSAGCSAEYYETEEPELEATAEPNNHLEGWSVSGAASTTCSGETSPCKIQVGTTNVTAGASFAFSGSQLTVEKGGSGTGTVSSVQSGLGFEAIACGLHCSELFAPATVVELAATAGEHSEFTGWTTSEGNPGNCTGTTSPCVVTISEATKLKADFELETEALTVNTSGPGGVECEFAHSGSYGPCASPQPYATDVKVKATPSVGAEVSSLSGTGSAGACSTGACEFEIKQASSVTVAFVAESEALTVNVSGSGSVECEFAHSGSYGACTSPQPYGTNVKVKATPNAGAEVGSLSGTGSAGACSTGGCEFEIKQASSVTVAFVAESEVLMVNVSGPGSVECEFAHSGTYGACTSPQPFGTNVKVKAAASMGAEVGSLSGTGSAGACSTAGCEFEIKQASSVTVAFTAESEALTVNVSGSGSVECEFAHSGSYGPCTSPQSYGTDVSVKATPDIGAELASLSGTGSANGCSTGGCEFEIKQASSVNIGFAVIANPSTLTIVKGGNGKGTVTSLAPHTGIICGLACEEAHASFEEGETVILEASAQSGSVFAGWIGCRHLTATTCQVKLDEPETEATAVFLIEGKEGTEGKEGLEGKEGKEGATGKEGPEGKAGKEGKDGKEGTEGKEGAAGKEGPAGKEGTAGKEGAAGKEGTAGKEGAKGAPGALGNPGFPGAQGEQGPVGPIGSAGAAGAQGVKGDTGAAGAAGPAGAQGKEGPAGPAGRVTCKITQTGKTKAKVICTVKYTVSAKSSALPDTLRWVLVAHGRVVEHGKSRGAPRIKLGSLRRGRYTLYLQGQHKGTVIHVG